MVLSLVIIAILVSSPALSIVFFRIANKPEQLYLGEDLPLEERIEHLLSLMTIEEKLEQLYGIAFFDTADNERLMIPGFKMSDGPHGVRDTFGNATCFPVGVAMTATWDMELIERIGTAMGKEFQGKGRNQALGPCIDIQRDPRNGRSPESGGEDPYLAGMTGTFLTRGIQSVGTIATVKHYAATNHQTNRHSNDYVIDERSFMEFYGLPFRLTVQQGGVWCVMSAYNYINGESCSTNYNLLTEILRDTWGYDYYVVSDWWSIYHGAAKSMNAGVDVDMPGDVYNIGLMEALELGYQIDPDDPSYELYDIIIEDTIDQAVRRVLRTKIVSGMINGSIGEEFPYFNSINSIEHQELALEAAQKGIVLLKNEDNILPLDNNTINSIALIGPSANVAQLDGFGSSWVTPFYTVTPKEGLENRAANVTINYEKGCDINSNDTSGFQDAIDLAAISDVVIFVGGLDKTQEGEGYDIGGDRKSGSVALPGEQQNLINELAAVNPNVIVVLKSGGICSVEDSFENIKGLLYAFYPGQEGGNAIADIIYGNVNPSGKLPVTMPVNDTQLPEWTDFNFTNDYIDGFGYRRFDSLNMTPRYPFGFGLSYTTFDYHNLSINDNDFETTNEVVVQLNVTNTGTIKGDEIVQLYLSTADISVDMPVKQLRGFKRVTLEPGQSKTVSLILGLDELAYWSTLNNSYVVEAGNYTVRVGGSSDNLPLIGNFSISSNILYNSANNTSSLKIGSTCCLSLINAQNKMLTSIYTSAIQYIGILGLLCLIYTLISTEKRKISCDKFRNFSFS